MLTVTDERPTSRALWTDAAAVVAVVVTVILAARQLRPLAEAGAFLIRTGESLTATPASTWPRAAAWVAISVAVLNRWRIVAAVGAWAAVLYEIVVAVRRIEGDPVYSMPLDLVMWPLLMAFVAASLLSVATAGRHGPDLLGRGGQWLLAGAATATTLSAAAIPLLGEYYGPPPADSFDSSFAIRSDVSDAVIVATFAVIGVLALAAVSSSDRAIRPRALTLLAAGTIGLVALELGLLRQFSL
jgi:hypothetical protein